MQYMWNDKELSMPPLITVPVKEIKFELLKLRKTLRNAINYYECQESYKENAILCSKLIQRRKNSFRHFKGFQDVCKANTAIKRLHKVDLPNVLKNYLGLLPESLYTLELPPKVNLDYLILRIIGYYKLLERICNCCKSAVAYFVRLLRNNFFTDILSLFLSVLSKIWYDGNFIAKFTAKLYCDLKKYLSLMPQNKIKHHFDDFEYPNNLCGSFLNDLPEEQSANRSKERNIPKPTIKMKENVSKPDQTHQICQSLNDIGEVISRDSFLITRSRTNQDRGFDTEVTDTNLTPSLENTEELDSDLEEVIDKNSFVPSIIEINSIKEIKKFFIDEDLRRTQLITKSSTKSISNKDWVKIKKKIFHNIKLKSEEDALKMFKNLFQKLNKKINT